MANAFNSIIRGLKEIEAHQKGTTPLRTRVLEIKPAPAYSPEAVKKLRRDLGMSQKSFAYLCGVSVKTVEAWESGRNVPSGSARRLFEVIEKDKTILQRGGILLVP